MTRFPTLSVRILVVTYFLSSQRRIHGFRATGETRHVFTRGPGSWNVRYPLPKMEKSADLAHYFSGVAKFCVQNKETSNLKRSMSGLNRIFTGKFPSKFHFYWGNSPVNVMVKILVGKVSPFSPVVDTPM